MSNYNVVFNNKNYPLDSSLLSNTQSLFKLHLSGAMKGEGASVTFDSMPYSINQELLATATRAFCTYLSSVAGQDMEVKINDIKYPLSMEYLAPAVANLEDVLAQFSGLNEEPTDSPFPIAWNVLEVVNNTSFNIDDMQFVKVSDKILTAEDLSACTAGIYVDGEIMKILPCEAVENVGFAIVGFASGMPLAVSVIAPGDYPEFGITIAEAGLYALNLGLEGMDMDVILKLSQAAPEAPVVKSVSDTTIEFNEIPNCQYGIRKGSSYATNELVWQDSPLFEDLLAGQEYECCCRYIGTDTHYMSLESEATILCTTGYEEIILDGYSSGRYSYDENTKVVTIFGEVYFYESDRRWQKNIGIKSFRLVWDNCEDCVEVVIPSSIKTIDSSAFSYGPFTTVTFEENSELQSIGDHAFYNCTNLTNINIPNGIVTLPRNTFYGCSSLVDIVLPQSLVTIERGVFQGTSSLQNIQIPLNVTSIDDTAFYHEYSEDLRSGLAHVVFEENSALSSLGKAFNFETLITIVMPDGVTEIGETNFSNCSNLTSVIFGENSNLTTIGNKTFYYKESLENINIPKNVTSIGDEAFSNCTKLTNINFAEDSKLTQLGIGCFENSGLSNIVLPDSLTSITQKAFQGCKNLNSVTFGNKVTEIQPMVFLGSGLTNITIPSHISTLGDICFRDCKQLISVDIQAPITQLSTGLFMGCENLEIISIPATVTTLRQQCVDNCKKLKINYAGTTSDWGKILRYTYWNVGCNSITVTCSNGVVTIPASSV